MAKVPPHTFSEDEQRRRDEKLLRLLKTPPQPRPKRERGEKKPSGKSAAKRS